MISRLLHRLNSAPRPQQRVGPTSADASKERSNTYQPGSSQCVRRPDSAAAVERSSHSDTVLRQLEVRPLSLV